MTGEDAHGHRPAGDRGATLTAISNGMVALLKEYYGVDPSGLGSAA
jgi:hypothetical protein